MKTWLHIIPNAIHGGIEKDCLYIIQTLQDDSHEVWVLGDKGPMTEQWSNSGAYVKILNILRSNFLKFYFQLSEKIKNQHYDGIFCWSPTRLFWIIHAASVLKCRMAVHIGNPLIGMDISGYVYSVLESFSDSRENVCLFSCSAYVKRSIKGHPYLSKFNNRVSLNPVNIPPGNNYVARELKQSSGVRLGMVSRFDMIKDHATVMHAFKIIRENYPESLLEFVGDGPTRAHYENLVESLNLKDKVIFKGTLHDVYDVIKSWDIFLYSTTQKEGLGNAVSEALANGIPVVASDLPMIREIDGGTGCISFSNPGSFDHMAETAVRLLNDPVLRNEKSKQSYERAIQAFSKTRYAEDRLNFLLG